MKSCKSIIDMHPDDNILILLLKNLPNGFRNFGEQMGFNPCADNPTFFDKLLEHLEPVVYFIISLI